MNFSEVSKIKKNKYWSSVLEETHSLFVFFVERLPCDCMERLDSASQPPGGACARRQLLTAGDATLPFMMLGVFVRS